MQENSKSIRNFEVANLINEYSDALGAGPVARIHAVTVWQHVLDPVEKSEDDPLEAFGRDEEDSESERLKEILAALETLQSKTPATEIATTEG